MRGVFVDTVYWVALVRPRDPWADAASVAKAELGKVLLVTTDEVLTEFLAALSRGGPSLRPQAVKMARAIMENPNVDVIPQTRDGFLKGMERYEKRDDKHYSLTDCISMNVMDGHSLGEVLTNDHHFEQEGFTILMR